MISTFVPVAQNLWHKSKDCGDSLLDESRQSFGIACTFQQLLICAADWSRWSDKLRPRESQDENFPNILRLIRLIALIESKEPHLVFRNISTLLATGCVPEMHNIAIYPQSPKLTFDLAQIHSCTSIRPTLLTYPKCNAALHDFEPKFSGPYILVQEFWWVRRGCRCKTSQGGRDITWPLLAHSPGGPINWFLYLSFCISLYQSLNGSMK